MPLRIYLCLIYILSTGFLLQSQTYIRTNQVGYRPGDIKSAVVFSNEILKGNFNVIDKDDKLVYTGPVIERRTLGYSPQKNYYTLDFSKINRQGLYKISIEGKSLTSVLVQTEAYNHLPDVLLQFMRQQRCGFNPYFHQLCHQLDGKIMGGGPLPDSTYVDVRGGWHDAGDQLKYLITASNATARMIMAYLMNPKLFIDSLDALGRPGANDIPDVLDEGKWGLDWILKLHCSPNQLIHMVGDDRDHSGWELPMNDQSNYGWGKNSYRVAYMATGQPQGLHKYKSKATGIANVAGRSAAALALGYQVWNDKKYDPVFASTCLKAAEELYDMALLQPGYQQGNSYGAPYRYNEDTWTDDMEWAATELYKATKNKKYLDDAKKYALLTGELSWIQRDTSAHYQFYPFLNIAHAELYQVVDAIFKKKLASYYRNGIKQTMIRAGKNVYSHGVPFIWCSNNLLVDLIIQIQLYEKMTGDLQFNSYKYSLRDWLFGRNPWGTSMFMNIPVTGIYPHDVHTSTYAITHQEVPGGLVDGPIYYTTYEKQIGLTLTHKDPFASFQNKYVVYHDDIGDYTSNEPTMDGTACAVLMMVCFAK
ncbi:MAG: glycoside hydrolase family 9 protein [Saprospiraceae bacterium]